MVTFLVVIFQYVSSYDDWEENLNEYIDCINDLWHRYHNDISYCSENLNADRPSDAAEIIISLVLSSLGFFGFLIIGFRRAIFDWWIEYFKHIWERKTLFPPQKIIRSSNIS